MALADPNDFEVVGGGTAVADPADFEVVGQQADPGDFEVVQSAAPDTSFGGALKYGLDQPIENIGVTAQVLGAPGTGAVLRGLTSAPQNYQSAGKRFINPQPDDFSVMGFAPAQLPRAIVEQFGQVAGSMISRVVGGLLGGAVGGGGGAAGGSVVPVAGTAAGGVGGLSGGAIAGQFLGPFLFGALQIAGPTALERAKRNGRTEATGEDIAYGLITAAGSGALDAIGAKYLPGGDKVTGTVAKRIASSFMGEGATEGAQALVEQTGESLGTQTGLDIRPKAAIGEALIGGGAGAAATTALAPFSGGAPATPEPPTGDSRTQPVTVDVDALAASRLAPRSTSAAQTAAPVVEVEPPLLPSGKAGPPDPIVMELDAVGAGLTAEAVAETKPGPITEKLLARQKETDPEARAALMREAAALAGGIAAPEVVVPDEVAPLPEFAALPEAQPTPLSPVPQSSPKPSAPAQTEPTAPATGETSLPAPAVAKPATVDPAPSTGKPAEQTASQAPARIQLKSGPATYSVVEQLPPQKGDQPGEVYFRVKNERTGEEQTVEAADMKPVKAKGAKVKAATKGGGASDIVAAMVDTGKQSVAELRQRVTNVRTAQYAKGQKFERIQFDLDGVPHEAELRGRNRDLLIGSGEVQDQAIAVRALLDGHAKPIPATTTDSKTMRRKLRGTESGAIPASLFADIADFGARLYRDGMDFAAWAKQMVRHLGERVRSALKEIWAGIINPKGARNLRGEVIQKRDQGGAIGAAGGRAEPKPGSPVEDGREGEYYTRVAERDRGTLSDAAWETVRNRTTLPDSFREDVDWAAKKLADIKDFRTAIEYARGLTGGLRDIFSDMTGRRQAALLFVIAQNAAVQRDAATDPQAKAYLQNIEAEAIASFSDIMSQGGKVLNIAGQLYAAMPMSPDAQVMAAEKLLARMTGGKKAEVEAEKFMAGLRAALTDALKSFDTSIRDILRNKPRSSWDEIRDQLINSVLLQRDFATDAERQKAADALIADFKARMEKAKKAMLKAHGETKNRSPLDKLFKLFEAGALDDDTAAKVFMERAGVKEFTPAFREKLRKMYAEAEAAPDGMPKSRILGNIAVELAMANPKTFGFWWNLAMSISYGNILGAFTTIFVNNPMGSAATAGEMTLMSALSNKGARRETLKGAVKTWARSFGDGVAMMRDLWSTGENLQKVSQFDSALVNSPVELLAKMAEDPAFPKKFKLAAKAVSQYKWVMRAMMAADAVIRWPAREAIRFTQMASIAKDTRKPGQSLEDAVDELNYPGGRKAAVADARQQAKAERADGTLKTALDERLRVIELLQTNLSPEGQEAVAESDELANYGSLLNDQPQDFIGVIASAILRVAFPSNTKSDIQKALGGAAQPFVRFVRTSANATRVLLDYAVGYGAFRYMTRNWPVIGAESLAGGANLIEGKAGDRLTQVRIQRAFLGMALYAGLAAIYAAIDEDDEDPYIDFIGSGPKSPDERRRVREAGIRLNSIKIGDKYIPTNVGPLQPLAGLLAPFQRMRDNTKWPKAKGELKDEHVPELAGVAVAKGIADAMMNQSFTRSLADFLTMANTGKTSFGETPEEFLAKNAAQFVPGNLRGLSQLDEIVSGKKERAEGFFDTAANGIAFYAPNGRAVTILGDDVDAGKTTTRRATEKVFQFTTLADDATLQFVVKNGLAVPDRQTKPDGRMQTYREYVDYMKKSGTRMRAWLDGGGMDKLNVLPVEGVGRTGQKTKPRTNAMNNQWEKIRREELIRQ